ncbi:unnamed protein product [Oncorhynchus mykiss]|uniref:Peptidase S1 domain-containing protein n=1 Tax=Oncorhynchus mykiss TaxID=8022 RepID=A0A060ZG03_ONCMY|nr:unnamed protein product [Oncorhynchus mykiss]
MQGSHIHSSNPVWVDGLGGMLRTFEDSLRRRQYGCHICLAPAGLTAHQDSGIVNGEKTKTNSKPYMVSVQERNKETEKTEHMCGGFLVSDNFVMTAAHCYTSGV